MRRKDGEFLWWNPFEKISQGLEDIIDGVHRAPCSVPSSARRRWSNKFKVEKQPVYDTGYSQAVTHPSTNPARRCLTSVIGREPVLSTWCGRRQGVQAREG